MKNLIALVAILFSVQAFAQEEDDNRPEKWGSDSLKCRQNFSLYNESLKQQMYKEAYKHWHTVMSICPANTESLYENGIFLTNFMMDKVSEERKQNLIDTTIWIYETKGKYFDVGHEWNAKYGSYVMGEAKDWDKAYEILKPVIDEWTEGITDFVYVYRFSQALMYRFAKAENKEQQDERRLEGIDYYEVMNARLDQALADGANESGVSKVRDFVDKHFLKFANSCESVIPVVRKKLDNLPEAKDEQIAVIKKSMNILEKIECEGEDIYGELLSKLIELEPSADAASRGGNYYRKKDNYSKALDFYKQAVELCGDCENVNKYKMGVVYCYFSMGSYKTVVSYAKGVGGKYRGEAYKYIAMSIAATSQSCGDTYFHRNLNYCLAVDYLEKAQANGESVSSLISKYEANFPTTDEAFELGISEGSTHTCVCWGESTVFRARK